MNESRTYTTDVVIPLYGQMLNTDGVFITSITVTGVDQDTGEVTLEVTYTSTVVVFPVIKTP